MRAHLLITGFGPFPGVADNPTARAALTLDGATLSGLRVAGRVLPTSWARAWPTLHAAVAALRPHAVLMLGVAARRSLIEVELVARNHAAARADVDGDLGPGGEVLPGAPATLRTRLPWEALLGEGVAASEDAGDYLCNALFYRALHDLRPSFVGFVHVPDGPVGPTLAFVGRVAARLVTLGVNEALS